MKNFIWWKLSSKWSCDHFCYISVLNIHDLAVHETNKTQRNFFLIKRIKHIYNISGSRISMPQSSISCKILSFVILDFQNLSSWKIKQNKHTSWSLFRPERNKYSREILNLHSMNIFNIFLIKILAKYLTLYFVDSLFYTLFLIDCMLH